MNQKLQMTIKNETQIELSDSNFKEKVIEQSKKIPIIVDFWAEWCMPCLMLSPILESLTEEYNGKFILAKANIEDVSQNAEKYNVSGIPSVKMFKNGEIVAEFVGVIPEETIKEWINKNL